MRTPSRFMPQYPEKRVHPFIKWMYAVGFFGAIGALIAAWPFVWGPLIAVMAVSILIENRRMSHIANSRAGESICTFSRSIGAKHLDTHVVRAVYEEVGKFLGKSDSDFPIRPTDELFEKDGFNLDFDDLDDLLIAIAFRTKRSLENTETNPYYDKIKTVSDLVQFVMGQPKIKDA